jgi:hypothetical protein
VIGSRSALLGLTPTHQLLFFSMNYILPGKNRPFVRGKSPGRITIRQE